MLEIGLILCTEASRDQIELMELDKMGIAVAEYWTALPPKSDFERKIGEIYAKAQERLERRKALPSGGQKQIDYFLDKAKVRMTEYGCKTKQHYYEYSSGYRQLSWRKLLV